MKIIERVKRVAVIVVSVGVSAVVSNAIKSTTPSSVGIIKKICIGIGGFVISSMISDKATKYTEQKIDEAVVEVKKAIMNDEI